MVIEEENDTTEKKLFVKCVVPSDLSLLKLMSKRQSNRNPKDEIEIIEPDLPENFMEAE